MNTRNLRAAAACALLATTSLTLPSIAHAAVPAPKFVDTIDDHGVDLVTGLPFFSIEEGGIGSGPGRVAMQRIWSEGAGFLDNWSGGLYDVTTSGVTKKYVQFAGISDTFSGSGTTWTSDKAEGATLVQTNSQTWTYTARDGTAIAFQNTLADIGFNCPGADSKTCRQPVSITYPSGLKFTLTWDTELICINLPGEPCGRTQNYSRLTGVSSSAGYSMAIAYQSNTATADMTPSDPWFKRTGIAFDNVANHPSPAPAIAYAYPSSTEVDVTDPAARTWKFFMDPSGRLTGVRRPGSASNNISYTYATSGSVNSSTKDGVTNTYAQTIGFNISIETVTDPLSHQRVVIADTTKGRPLSDKDGLNHTTAYAYDANARLTKITAPENNFVQYTYDGRGNVTDAVVHDKTDTSTIATHASFDVTCSNIVKCNQPNNTTDAKGYVTDYTYDATHGGVTTITQPAAVTNGIRPQTRYTYSQISSASGDLVYMPTEVAACQTLAGATDTLPAACAGAADETQVVAAYNSNLLPTSVTRQDGTATLVSTTALTYDARGRLDTINGPLADTVNPPTLTLTDTTKYLYDNADQVTQVTSPDPDGYGTSGGALPSRAIKLTYRSDGQVSKQELGTAAADGSGFTAVQTADITFDTNNRPVTSKLSASATDYALTQTSYDALGRVDCSAVRMNIAVYGSLPASACSPSTQGSFGPDPISQNVYDAAGEVTQLKVGVGTSDAATERTLTYTNNGLVQTLLDGENNLTTYTYDGFDRLSQTQYPNTTKGSGTSNASDYEQLSYDANSNVITRRLRDATSIGFTYDKLDRVTAKDLPGTEPDVTYGYDLLGRLTSANQSGNNLAFTYDALSRNLTQVRTANTHVFTVSLAYDAAGRRTQLTYPAAANALAVTYDYLTTGELTAIKQSGASLASYTYDNLGNRTALTFANGVVQNFTYDPVSRLASLSNDLPGGSTNDLTIGTPATPITYNPASQIKSLVRTGDAYAYAVSSENLQQDINGRNQVNIVTVPGISVSVAGWDSKGNLTGDPITSKTYGYSSENLLTSATGGVTLGYESLNRLYQVAGTSTTRFLYDGLDSISEYDGNSALLRRFVFDPTTHQPLVWYEGTTTSSPRYLSADERGSIVSVTDSSGALIGINTYDEYGRPGASNIGRFQYTGQRWVNEIGAYDYKARAYLPHLGIFAQTDPIGQVDSPNLYAYVGDDPVNLVDPLGLTDCPALGVSAGDNCPSSQPEPPPITVTGIRACSSGAICIYPNAQGLPVNVVDNRPIVVTATRKQNNNQCTNAPNDPTSRNLADERAFFDEVATISDVVFVGAAVTAVFFPPAATVAAVAKGFSIGATAVSAGFAVGQSIHTGDVSYAGGAGLQAIGGIIGGKIGSRAAFGALSRTQLRIGGRFGPNAFKAYNRAIERGSASLGSAAAGVGICH